MKLFLIQIVVLVALASTLAPTAYGDETKSNPVSNTNHGDVEHGNDSNKTGSNGQADEKEIPTPGPTDQAQNPSTAAPNTASQGGNGKGYQEACTVGTICKDSAQLTCVNAKCECKPDTTYDEIKKACEKNSGAALGSLTIMATVAVMLLGISNC